jgi:hypothetical protein
MLRQLVASSLQDYLAFFRQHAAVQQLDPQQGVALWSCGPVFETELVVQGGESGGTALMLWCEGASHCSCDAC